MLDQIKCESLDISLVLALTLSGKHHIATSGMRIGCLRRQVSSKSLIVDSGQVGSSPRKKFIKRFIGPSRVVELLSPTTYLVKDIPANRNRRRGRMFPIHTELLLLYYLCHPIQI